MTAKYAFVSAERANHAAATLCRVAGVSVSGFYAWLHAIHAVQVRAETEAELRGHIGRIFAARRRVYGSPRIHAELRREGRRHSRRHVERLRVVAVHRVARAAQPAQVLELHGLILAPRAARRRCGR